MLAPGHDTFASGIGSNAIRLRQLLAIIMQVALFAAILGFKPLEGHDNLRLLIAVEVILVGWVVFRLVRVLRTRALQRNSDGNLLRESVLATFGSTFGHIILAELTIWTGLWRLVTRRFRTRQPEFTYHRRSADYGMLLVVIVTAPVEILIVELLIPWPIVRWVLLLTAIYSVIWFAGLVLAPMVHPHIAARKQLVLRNGATARVTIDYSNIAVIDPLSLPWPDTKGRFPSPMTVCDDVAWLQSGSHTTLRLDLYRPILVASGSAQVAVQAVVIAADDPDALIHVIEQRKLGEPATH
jgi:hypothetical protein